MLHHLVNILFQKTEMELMGEKRINERIRQFHDASTLPRKLKKRNRRHIMKHYQLDCAIHEFVKNDFQNKTYRKPFISSKLLK